MRRIVAGLRCLIKVQKWKGTTCDKAGWIRDEILKDVIALDRLDKVYSKSVREWYGIWSLSVWRWYDCDKVSEVSMVNPWEVKRLFDNGDMDKAWYCREVDIDDADALLAWQEGEFILRILYQDIFVCRIFFGDKPTLDLLNFECAMASYVYCARGDWMCGECDKVHSAWAPKRFLSADIKSEGCHDCGYSRRDSALFDRQHEQTFMADPWHPDDCPELYYPGILGDNQGNFLS